MLAFHRENDDVGQVHQDLLYWAARSGFCLYPLPHLGRVLPLQPDLRLATTGLGSSLYLA